MGARFQKYLTIYHKIILSISYDRLTIVTYDVLSSSEEYRKIILTILQVNRTPEKTCILRNIFFKLGDRRKSIVSLALS